MWPSWTCTYARGLTRAELWILSWEVVRVGLWAPQSQVRGKPDTYPKEIVPPTRISELVKTAKKTPRTQLPLQALAEQKVLTLVQRKDYAFWNQAELSVILKSVNELIVLWELGQVPYSLWISVVYISKFLEEIKGLVHIKGPRVVLGTHSTESNCWILVTIMSKTFQAALRFKAEHRKQIPRLSNNQAAQLVTKLEIMVWTLWSWGYKH